MDEVLEDATRAAYPTLVDKKKIMAHAIAKLRQPDICQAMTDAFAINGFSMEDAIQTHIGHIKGTHVRQIVTKMGIEEVRVPPSYAALQGFYKLTVPEKTKQVQIEHSNLNDMLNTIEAADVVDAIHRTVGEIIDVDPEEDPDDIDPFIDEEVDDDDEESDDEA